MTKNATRGILILVILLVAFTAAAFAIPFLQNIVFWAAYFCGLIAILLQVYFFRTSFSKADAVSRFYGFPIARVGICYLVVQLCASFIEMALSYKIPEWMAILANILILAAALVGCITTETIRDEIVRQDETLKQNMYNMREMQTAASAMADRCDGPMKDTLRKIAEELRYSDPVSSGRTAGMEADLRILLDRIRQAMADGDTETAGKLCEKFRADLAERNFTCKMSK